jgi:hypothetical protein
MIRVEILGLEEALRNLDQAAREQIPFATARALTRTAQRAQAATYAEMRRVFDRPTPFTLSALRVSPAAKARLEAAVQVKDEATKATTAIKAIGHQMTGGPRWWKRSEGALRRLGLLAEGENAVPAAGAKLDAFGNMSRGQIVQILSWFQAFGEQGYRANTSAESRTKKARGTARTRGVGYYYRRDAPGRGVYMRVQTGFGSAIKPVLLFVRRANYTKRLDMPAVVARTVDEQFAREFAQAFREAMQSAR